MDPTETLRRTRNLLKDSQEAFKNHVNHQTELELLREFADLFESLDYWLKMGGFAPYQWREPNYDQ